MTASASVRGLIFISYRRADTAFAAGWLHERLASHYGEGRVFRDVQSLAGGDDFAAEVKDAVASCTVLLALIGPRWLTATDDAGRRRLDNPSDLVRLEIEAALTSNVRIIPILVDGADMPRAAQLPPVIARLAEKHALDLSPHRFATDLEPLLKVLDRTVAAVRYGNSNAVPPQPTVSAVPRTGRPLRVLLVEDHAVVRQGFRTLLDAYDDIEVVAEAESGRAAIAAAESSDPDIVLMDIALADGPSAGVEATREIRDRHARVRVLMLTADDDQQALFASIMAGANGYVLKQIDVGQLVAAVRTVAQGRDLIDPAVTGALLERIRSAADRPGKCQPTELSGQEARILRLIGDKQSNAEIGHELGLAGKTVRNYISSILRKLDAADGRRQNAI